jgi:hypothetical protein
MKILHPLKFSITVVTTVLFLIGAISGMLIICDYLITPHITSKEQAIITAIHSSGLTPEESKNTTINAELLQAKLSNRVAFVINYYTMSPDYYPKVVSLPSLNFKENQLFWSVTIDEHLQRNVILKTALYREWICVIDATNGTLIQSWGPSLAYKNF